MDYELIEKIILKKSDKKRKKTEKSMSKCSM